MYTATGLNALLLKNKEIPRVYNSSTAFVVGSMPPKSIARASRVKGSIQIQNTTTMSRSILINSAFFSKRNWS